VLIKDLECNGNEGIGNRNHLARVSGLLVRRITGKHRLVYKITEDKIRVAA
jgi:Txe/YoeB family toxin of Txe-Axe toxin-antitoxin module